MTKKLNSNIDEYIAYIKDKINTALSAKRNGVYLISEYITNEVAKAVNDYITNETTHIIKMKKCSVCDNMWEIIIMFH